MKTWKNQKTWINPRHAREQVRRWTADFGGREREELKRSLQAGENSAGRVPWRLRYGSPALWTTWRGSDSSKLKHLNLPRPKPTKATPCQRASEGGRSSCIKLWRRQQRAELHTYKCSSWLLVIADTSSQKLVCLCSVAKKERSERIDDTNSWLQSCD